MRRNYESSDSTLDFIERQNARERRPKAAALASILSSMRPKISDFHELHYYSPSDIIDDSSHAQKLRRKYAAESLNQQGQPFHAKALEALMSHSIATGQWLSGTNEDGQRYTAESIYTTDYDDMINRVDSAATVRTMDDTDLDGENPIEPHPVKITFGIDLTVNTDLDVIRQKITTATNDSSAHLPTGFTQIKYYQDKSGNQKKLTNVPRYVIGINDASIDNILDNVVIENGNINIQNGYAAIDLANKYKILREIRLQNEYYSNLLLDKDAEERTMVERIALHQVELLDGVYGKELSAIEKRLNKKCNDLDTQYRATDKTFDAILRTVETLKSEHDTEIESAQLKNIGKTFLSQADLNGTTPPPTN